MVVWKLIGELIPSLENTGIRPILIYRSYLIILEGSYRRVITVVGAYGAHRHPLESSVSCRCLP